MKITLYRDMAAGAWMAHHSGPGADEVIELFGTDRLPTTFTVQTSAPIVLRELQQLNPQHEVRLIGIHGLPNGEYPW